MNAFDDRYHEASRDVWLLFDETSRRHDIRPGGAVARLQKAAEHRDLLSQLDLWQRRKFVFDNSQAPDDYDIRAAQSSGNRCRAGGGQDLHFTSHESLDAGCPARYEKQFGVDSVARENSRLLS